MTPTPTTEPSKKESKGKYAGQSSDNPVEGRDFDKDEDFDTADEQTWDEDFEALEDDAFLKEEQSKFDEEGGAQAHEFRHDRKDPTLPS